MDAKPLPLTAEGQARYAKIAAGLKSGALIDQSRFYCVPEGMPRALTSAYPFQIIMTNEVVVFAHETNRAYRMVTFAHQHADPAVWDPSYMGDGIARWDGATLVIDATNFKADHIFLDASGLPASDRLHLVERIRVTGSGTLVDEITIDDPVIFTKPWTARLSFHRRDDLQLKTDCVWRTAPRPVGYYQVHASEPGRCPGIDAWTDGPQWLLGNLEALSGQHPRWQAAVADRGQGLGDRSGSQAIALGQGTA